MKKRSLEKRRHVVAWTNKAEWDQVLEYLYSKDPALQRYALQRISAWRGRYANSSPVAVDCTADLVRCQVLDRPSPEAAGWEPEHPSVGGRPEHDFTHRKLPTLKWCRKGCKVVLEWLQHEYWSRQLGGGPGEDWESESDGEDEEADLKGGELIARQKEMEAYKNARELLISYEKEQYQAFDGLPEDKEKNMSPPPFADMSWLLVCFAVQYLLIDVLLEDGFLVPTAEQLETLGCDSFDSAAQTPSNLTALLAAPREGAQLPSFIHVLLEKLFVELKQLAKEQNNNQRAFYISTWISEIILCNSNKFEYHFETKGQKKARMKDRIFVNRIQLRWQQLLSACLDAPCVSTPHLLQLILDDMEHPLPLETRQRLLQLCSIYTQIGHSECDTFLEHKQQPIYTLESLHEKLQQSRRHSQRWRSTSDAERRSESSEEHKWADAQAEKAKLLRGSPWQVCNDKVLWKNYPLGKVPGQSDDPSCLMVENYSTMTVFDQRRSWTAVRHTLPLRSLHQ
ncbi:hypothetical protein F7725_000164 [Dissostichus mawsoni]|uniref:LAS1-like protein n=1 Tax=Dissostichus mawsoni TaxID=36200 RepID=A0A7J5ZFY2_DISMA|nr:hypothetical protein F7725_000164 [Dissostichus mawsoni]